MLQQLAQPNVPVNHASEDSRVPGGSQGHCTHLSGDTTIWHKAAISSYNQRIVVIIRKRQEQLGESSGKTSGQGGRGQPSNSTACLQWASGFFREQCDALRRGWSRKPSMSESMSACDLPSKVAELLQVPGKSAKQDLPPCSVPAHRYPEIDHDVGQVFIPHITNRGFFSLEIQLPAQLWINGTQLSAR